MKLILHTLGALVLVVLMYIGFAWYEGQDGIYTSDLYTFNCPNDAQFTVQYNESKSNARLSVSGTQYELRRDQLASGVRYRNTESSVLFWERQGEARLRLPGQSQEITCRL